jgi:hypothetical protein
VLRVSVDERHTTVSLDEVSEVSLVAATAMQLTTLLTLKHGESILLPPVGKQTFDVYRTLAGLVQDMEPSDATHTGATTQPIF